MPMIIRQDWEESERGWGIRPDGYSLHLKLEDVKKYIDGYWSKMPDEVPDEYSRPAGQPRVVDVDQTIFDEVAATENGRRFFG